jgi:serine/threonine protein kinase
MRLQCKPLAGRPSARVERLPMMYMSPEQLRGSKHIDARTDIWSLGCVLYELLTNRLAFDASSITEVTALILEREPPSLRGDDAGSVATPPDLEPFAWRGVSSMADIAVTAPFQLGGRVAARAEQARGAITGPVKGPSPPGQCTPCPLAIVQTYTIARLLADSRSLGRCSWPLLGAVFDGCPHPRRKRLSSPRRTP